MRVFRPSGSSIDSNKASSASVMASRNSPWSGVEPSSSLTRALRMTVKRLLRALPATVTNVPKARALKTDMGEAVRVGISTGNTVDARTCVTLFNET
jgi:hypothetical protein